MPEPTALRHGQPLAGDLVLKPAHLTPPGLPGALPSDNGSERARHALEQFWLGQQQHNGDQNPATLAAPIATHSPNPGPAQPPAEAP